MSNQHEMLQELLKKVTEISDRSRRTETNLHKVREHLGIAGPESSAKVVNVNDVDVNGHDVTLAQIRHALHNAPNKYEKEDHITVRCKGSLIAVLTFLE